MLYRWRQLRFLTPTPADLAQATIGLQDIVALVFCNAAVRACQLINLQATVEDLEPPSALSVRPADAIQNALMSAYERDFTHLTVISEDTRSLLGYLAIPHLKALLKGGSVQEADRVEKAMTKFVRKGKAYRVITMQTPLEELEAFFRGGVDGKSTQEFAVVTDTSRRFVLGVATRHDLEEFARRRPA